MLLEKPQEVSHVNALDDFYIKKALSILDNRVRQMGISYTQSADVINYLRLQLESEEREVFVALFLDTQHRLIECRRMFLGTVNSVAVYSREILRTALQLNAVAIIVSHNHPSGIVEPSHSDRTLTEALKGHLSGLELRMLDHIIIGKGQHVSFAERGWI